MSELSDPFLQALIEDMSEAIEDPEPMTFPLTVVTDWGHGIRSSITYDLPDPSPGLATIAADP